MLSDADQRIRTEAINALCDFNLLQIQRIKYNSSPEICLELVTEFISKILSHELKCDLTKSSLSPITEQSVPAKRHFGHSLFNLTNMLLNLESNERQVRKRHFISNGLVN